MITLEAAQKVRLILGDQLNATHSWFRTKDPNILYLIAELHQEASYTRHHVQKVCAFFQAMHNFADALVKAGHRVCYLTLDETAEFQDLPHLIAHIIDRTGATRFEYQQPDEYRLSQQLLQFSTTQPVKTLCVASEHFFLEHRDFSTYCKAKKAVRMENFYRKIRLRFDVLMEGENPIGGKWNYDTSNREALTPSDLDDIPQPLLFASDVSAILTRLKRHNIETIGHPNNRIVWPTTRTQARELLSHFCQFCLPNFGRFQDAMTQDSEYAWSLYHSRISFSLNTKMLSPRQVIDAAVDAFKSSSGSIDIAQIEGFVRQILGWREYVRAMYWINMPDYRSRNQLKAVRTLPEWFWTANTRMNCLHKSIEQSLQFAYAHHIQRLMITGNFSLLAGIDPDQVDDWYLGIYIDAIEWVELPNTRGMSQFADGGWIASKPYAASGNYIHKMSDYCASCYYNVKIKTGNNACPFNLLYWGFIDRHLATFEKNPRMSFPVKNWLKRSPQDRLVIRQQADSLLENLDEL